MNSYDRLYNILTESTPLGREESKTVGKKHARLRFSKFEPQAERERGLARVEGGEALPRGRVRLRTAARTRSKPKPAPNLNLVRAAGSSEGVPRMFSGGSAWTRPTPQEM